MSLHALANHMAAQGRNNDSMLVHMTPKEVGGLHALAVANGGQLTINPETGLPEAGFLQDLLPALIGFGLNTFLPGLGTAVGGAFGLGAAAGTGIAVGGLTALATGNLSKGVMAGFGAYGGAGLGESLVGAGVNAATNAGTAGYESILADKGFIPGTPEYGAAASELALGAQNSAKAASLASSPMDRLTAGFSATTQSPETLMNYAGGNWKYGVAAAAPALAGLSEEDDTVTKMPSTGMITPFVMNKKAVPRDESLSPSAQQRYFNYDVTPITPIKAANGGAVQHFRMGGVSREYGDADIAYEMPDIAAQKALMRAQRQQQQAALDPEFLKNIENYSPDLKLNLIEERERDMDLRARAPVDPNLPDVSGYMEDMPQVIDGLPNFGREGGNSNDNMRPGGDKGNGVGTTDPYTQQFLDKAKTYKNTMTGDSASAFDYLMGNTRPGVPATTDQQKRPGAVRMPGVDPTVPASTAGIQALANIVRGDGGGGNKSFDAGSGSASTNNPFKYDPNSLSGGIVHALLNPTPNAAPIVDTTGYSSVAEAEAAGLQKLANQYGMYNNPNANLTPTGTNVGTVSQPNPISGYSIGPAASIPAANPITQDPAQQQQAAAAAAKAESDARDARENAAKAAIRAAENAAGSAHTTSTSGGTTSNSTLSDHITGQDSANSRDSDARGGFLNHGRFDQRYADGGVTGGGSLDLHVPINIGGGGGSTGAETFGGGFGGGNGIQQGAMPQPPMGGLGGLLGQTQPQSNAFGGGMGGIRSGLGQANQGLFGGTPMSKPSYEQYLAGRSPYQQDLQLSRAQYENPQQGPSTPGNRMADGGMTGMADGGLGSLGGYSDGGRLLRGPGDGVSDSIPATIGQHQPARLADGEFVVPARIVSELGNGSTEAGARQLYAMMDRIQKGRKKTVGKNKVAANTRAAKHLPA